MSEAVIQTEGLSKDFGHTHALQGLDLTVHAGDVFGFIGPNGAGKSTTMRILMDVLRPTSGTVRVLGTDPRTGGGRLRARIGYLPGELALDGRSEVGSWLDYQARLHGAAPGAWRPYAERLGLDPGRRIGKLSRGNKQKVGLARAFAHRPELLVLDEPTGGLDPLMQQEFLVMVREARSAGQTIFLSSHILSELEHVAETVGVLRQGRLVARAPLTELRDRLGTRVTVETEHPLDPAPVSRLEGVDEVRADGTLLTVDLHGSPDALVKHLSAHHVVHLRAEAPDLETSVLRLYHDDEEAGR
jgi:ABC-2 type transport system ATP-binding protein